MKKLICLLIQVLGFMILFFVFFNPLLVNHLMSIKDLNNNSYHSFLIMTAFALIFLGICGFLSDDKTNNKNYEKMKRGFLIRK